MYYIRYHDRDKVNYNFEKGKYYFRPFPDEDNVQIGMYEQFDRSYIVDFSQLTILKKEVIIQLYNKELWLLVNLPCYHGVKLPDLSSVENAKTFLEWKKEPAGINIL